MNNKDNIEDDIVNKYRKYKRAAVLMHKVFRVAATLMKVGIVIKEIDAYIGNLFKKYGLMSAPKCCYDFPSYTCISINDCLCHGIANEYALKVGDIVKLDVSFKYNDIFIDACRSFIIVDSVELKINKDILTKLEMYAFLKQSMSLSISILDHRLQTEGSVKYRDFGSVFERIVASYGKYTISDVYGGHGIGAKLHLQPFIASVTNSIEAQINNGDTFCIEPILSFKTSVHNYIQSYVGKDGWSVFHKERLPTAHYENTYMRLKNRIIRIT